MNRADFIQLVRVETKKPKEVKKISKEPTFADGEWHLKWKLEDGNLSARCGYFEMRIIGLADTFKWVVGMIVPGYGFVEIKYLKNKKAKTFKKCIQRAEQWITDQREKMECGDFWKEWEAPFPKEGPSRYEDEGWDKRNRDEYDRERYMQEKIRYLEDKLQMVTSSAQRKDVAEEINYVMRDMDEMKDRLSKWRGYEDGDKGE